jgi:hypothetical protein
MQAVNESDLVAADDHTDALFESELDINSDTSSNLFQLQQQLNLTIGV